MARQPTASEISNASNTAGTQKTYAERVVNALAESIGGSAEGAYTISAGSIKPEVSVFSVDTEGGASSDNLDHIDIESDSATRGMADGRVILLRAANASRTVVVRHNQAGTGRVVLADAANLSLDATDKWLLLQLRSSAWHEVGRFYGADAAAAREFLGLTSAATATEPSSSDAGKVLGVDGSGDYALLGPMRGFRNALINGDFRFWRRGTSFTSDGYTADRWRINVADGSATITQESVQSASLGEESKYVLRWTQTGAATSNPVLDQRIESVRTLAGRSATVSFYARADASVNVSVNFRQNFGSGGSSEVDISAQTVSLSTSWERHTVTFSIPSVVGKTIGSGDFLRLRFFMPAGDTYQIDLGRVQVEEGDVATAFERRPPAVEESLCNRYYWKSYNLDTDPGSTTNFGQLATLSTGTSSASVYVTAQFPVPMRARPSITLYNPVTGATGEFRRDGSTDVAAVATFIGERACTVTADESTTDNAVHTVHVEADAEL